MPLNSYPTVTAPPIMLLPSDPAQSATSISFPDYYCLTEAKIAATRVAFEKVVNTVELLDNILQYLPPKNIFGVQRANKTFYKHIHGDTLAAKRLYLSPKSYQAELTCVLRDSQLVRDDLFQLPFRYRTKLDVVERYVEVQIDSFTHGSDLQSWSEVYLTQPPVKEMRTTYLQRPSGGWKVPLLRRENGIKLRDLIEFLESIRAQAEEEGWRHPIYSSRFAFFAHMDENGYLQDQEGGNGSGVEL